MSSRSKLTNSLYRNEELKALERPNPQVRRPLFKKHSKEFVDKFVALDNDITRRSLQKYGDFVQEYNSNIKSSQKKLSRKISNSTLNNDSTSINASQKSLNSKEKTQHGPTSKMASIFQRTLNTIYRQDFSSSKQSAFRQTSFWTERKDDFNSTLTKFSQLKANQMTANHSPRHNIEGASEQKGAENVMNVTMRQFKTLDPIKDQYKAPVKKQKPKLFRSLNLPEVLKVDKQTSRERKDFYSMHPYLLENENQKSLERKADKRVNLIGLEKLYIKNQEKKTSKIFKTHKHRGDQQRDCNEKKDNLLGLKRKPANSARDYGLNSQI